MLEANWRSFTGNLGYDPTQVDILELRAGPLSVEFQDIGVVAARVYWKNRQILFASEAVNRWIFYFLDRAYQHYQDRRYAKLYMETTDLPEAYDPEYDCDFEDDMEIPF